MRIALPYNEILPTNKAHDAFLFKEASEFTSSGCDVHLIVGQGSLSSDKLALHYGTAAPTHLVTCPILRKNNPLNLSWNFPFFWSTRRYLQRIQPDVIVMSVLKQAADLLAHRQPGSFYIYEAHEVAVYPHQTHHPRFALEKWVLEHADCICVTTHQLKEILQRPPYTICTPIHVIPLAVEAQPLPLPSSNLPPTVTYVGQLYKEQGIEDLLKAMEYAPKIHLRIIGGKPEDIKRLDRHQPNVTFEGYVPPSQLSQHVSATHAFIAPFRLEGRMPYVAHTKLYEYQAWGRIILAPAAAIVKEHVSADRCIYYHDQDSLVRALQQIPSLPFPQPKLFPWHQRIKEFFNLSCFS